VHLQNSLIADERLNACYIPPTELKNVCYILLKLTEIFRGGIHEPSKKWGYIQTVHDFAADHSFRYL